MATARSGRACKATLSTGRLATAETMNRQKPTGGVMKPMLDVVGKLIAILIEEDPESQHVRLRTLALLGGVMVFRMANAAARAQLGWKAVGPREVEAVQGLARELVAAIGPKGRDR